MSGCLDVFSRPPSFFFFSLSFFLAHIDSLPSLFFHLKMSKAKYLPKTRVL